MSPDGVKEAEEKNRKRVALFQEEQWGEERKKKIGAHSVALPWKQDESDRMRILPHPRLHLCE